MKEFLFAVSGVQLRKVTVAIEGAECFECREVKKCLIFAASAGEYSEIIFCLGCLTRFYEGYQSARCTFPPLREI